MSTADTVAVVWSGLMSPGLARQGLEQHDLDLSPRDLGAVAGGALPAPRMAARLLPVVAHMERLRWHHRQYPSRPEDLPRWAAAR